MIDLVTRDLIWTQLDFMLALQGEDIDAPAARAALDELLAERGDELLPKGWPKDNRRGEQSNVLTALAAEVLDRIGKAPPPQVVHAVPDIGKWDDREGAPEIIRKPIGS